MTRADCIFVNGKIVTLDETLSIHEAVAVSGGRITAVGLRSEIEQFADAKTQVVDLDGRTVLPGLIDAHCHPMETIQLKERWIDCRYPGVDSVRAALANIRAAVAKQPPGQWAFAAAVSASQDKFAEKRLPTKAELDEASPNNPLVFANGTHLGVANSAGLRKLGVTAGVSKLPRGGTAQLDDSGQPTGVLTDVMSDVPTAPTPKQMVDIYTNGIHKFWNSYGFTSALAITPTAALPVIDAVAKSGTPPAIRLTLSLWATVDGQGLPGDLLQLTLSPDVDKAWYRIAGVKAWVDGENDCRTGLMHDPYVGNVDTDPPGDRGTQVTTGTQALDLAQRANTANLICMFRCSGDAAVDEGLDTYEKVGQDLTRSSIMRIEHFGMFQLTDKQLTRARQLRPKGLFISVQPFWMQALAKSNLANSGPARAATAFKFRSMIEAGLEPAGSTDTTGIYLASVNPFTAIHAAVTRASDAGVFEPEQAISVVDALKMWTIWAARSMGEAASKGTIEVGKYADPVVLSDDILTMPTAGVADLRAVLTTVDGRIVYDAR